LYDNADSYGLTLPKKGEHYLWESTDGSNTYQHRKDRTKQLLSVAANLDIEVLEHNLAEGNEQTLTL